MDERLVEALRTGAGMLWKALWALIFGYLVSAGIQVLVTRVQMARVLGARGARQGLLAAFFGFVSSSCSFAALAASRSVLVKGAHPVNALVFLVASTNLVIELGIVLLILLGWKFLVGNVLVGILMILFLYLLTAVWFPDRLAESARKHARERTEEGMQHRELGQRTWKEKLGSMEGWRAIADAFLMEWRMAYKEILFGFAAAGFISVFVPQSFWNSLFLHGGRESPSLLTLIANAAVAPVVAFFTFIGSMGNVPLAAMLWSKQASFGGVMTFLGADLVAATVLYINAKYYGWRYTAVTAGLLYACMVAAGLTVHGLFALAGAIPTDRRSLAEMVRFELDYTFWLNLLFVLLAAGLLLLRRTPAGRAGVQREHAGAGTPSRSPAGGSHSSSA